jgi:hypothetical protein
MRFLKGDNAPSAPIEQENGVIANVEKRLRFFYGWIVVGGVFVTMALGVNARTAFSLLLPPILDEFGWGRGVTAGAFSFGFLISAVLSPALGRLMDRRGLCVLANSKPNIGRFNVDKLGIARAQLAQVMAYRFGVAFLLE